MKAVLILVALVGLLSCRPYIVESEDITQLTYGITGGIAGVDFKYTLNDIQQRFQSRQCDMVISYADWRTLLTDFYVVEYERLPEKVSPDCCDQFLYSLDITTGKKMYHREWSTFSHVNGQRLPRSVAKIDSVLSQRAWTEAQACR